MMKNLLGVLLLIFINLAVSGQSIDTDRSVVSFKIKNMKFRTVTGTFSGMNGVVNFDKAKLENASFDVCVLATSINTQNEKMDDHLKTEDFFDVEQYPNICFQSKKIEQSKDGFTTTGILEMHGVKKQVDIPFSFNGTSFEGALKINRLDFNLGEGTGEFLVSNELELTIHCILH